MMGMAACMLTEPSESVLTSGAKRCPAGQKGCETRCVGLSDPATGCAMASCEPCVIPQGQPGCERGSCAVGQCESGWANCDGIVENGCEEQVAPGATSCTCHAIRLTTPKAFAQFTPSGFDVGQGDWTLEVWTKLSGPLAPLVVTNPGYGINTIALYLESDPPRLRCSMYVEPMDPTKNTTVSERSVALGLWQHLACVRKNNELRAYVSGEPSAAAVADAVLAANGKTAILGAYNTLLLDTPLLLGPLRFSRVARYGEAFAPAPRWPIDKDTVAQFLVYAQAQDVGTTLILRDEAMNGNQAQTQGGIVVEEEDTPCSQ